MINTNFELTEEMINEHLGSPNNRRGSENIYQCPKCVEEGGDTSGDNLHHNIVNYGLICRANKEHSKKIFLEIKAKYAPKSNFISTKDIEVSDGKLKEYSQCLMNNPEKMELLRSHLVKNIF